MTNHDDAFANQFSDWLDRSAAGMSTPESGGDADPDMTDLRAAADQFHGLDQRLTDYAVSVSSSASSWEDVMTRQSSAVVATPKLINTPPIPERQSHSSPHPSAWSRVATAILAAVVVIALAAGAWRASDRLGFGGSNEDQGESMPFGSWIPAATPASEDPVVAYLPPEACTVEPMTRDEVIAHLEQARIATADDSPRYDQPQAPDAAQVDAIMDTAGMWFACEEMLNACEMECDQFARLLQFESPWFTQATMLAGAGYDVETLDDETIAFLADLSMAETEADRQAIIDRNPDLMPPLPAEYATPIADGSDSQGESFVAPPWFFEGWYSTIVADQIVLTGPSTASAPFRLYDPVSRSIRPGPAAYRVDFVLIDGVWLIDAFSLWEVVPPG